MLELPEDAKIKVGAKGSQKFSHGVYVYVGSAQSGLEQRVARHMRSEKRHRWHIDYFLDKAELVSTIMIPSGFKATECQIARTLLGLRGAKCVVDGFGSSDCDCPTHLIYFRDEDSGWVSEEVARTMAMLPCVYPQRTGPKRE